MKPGYLKFLDANLSLQKASTWLMERPGHESRKAVFPLWLGSKIHAGHTLERRAMLTHTLEGRKHEDSLAKVSEEQSFLKK